MRFLDFVTELYKPKELDKLRQVLSKKVTDVDTRDPSWMYSLNDVMAAYGFDKLGAGKYASVFGNKSYPYVIKVFMKDSAYIRWVSLCLKNRRNKYCPKIKGKVVKLTPLVYAIRLEKLKPTYFGGEFADAFSKWQSNQSYRTDDQDINDILDFFVDNKNLLDLHSDNVMARGNQMVIIDPFYNWFNKHKPMDYTIDPHEVDTSVF